MSFYDHPALATVCAQIKSIFHLLLRFTTFFPDQGFTCWDIFSWNWRRICIKWPADNDRFGVKADAIARWIPQQNTTIHWRIVAILPLPWQRFHIVSIAIVTNGGSFLTVEMFTDWPVTRAPVTGHSGRLLTSPNCLSSFYSNVVHSFTFGFIQLHKFD